MKKVIFIVTLIMMMAFSGLCFAADGNDLNKEQKVAETFMEVFTKDQIPAYDVVSKDFSDTLKTNVDRVIGMEGIVAEEISNLAGTGKVSLGGNTWTARTESEGGIIPKETVVEVLRVEGVKLIVKVKEKEGGNET